MSPCSLLKSLENIIYRWVIRLIDSQFSSSVIIYSVVDSTMLCRKCCCHVISFEIHQLIN